MSPASSSRAAREASTRWASATAARNGTRTGAAPDMRSWYIYATGRIKREFGFLSCKLWRQVNRHTYVIRNYNAVCFKIIRLYFDVFYERFNVFIKASNN